MEFTWVRLPVELIGRYSANSLILFSLLLNRDQGDHTIQCRQQELAATMHCTVRCINKLLHELEEAGLILSRSRMRNCTCMILKPDILPPRKKQASPEGKASRGSRRREAWEAGSSIPEGLYERVMNPYGDI